jgi:hypothetical protein
VLIPNGWGGRVSFLLIGAVMGAAGLVLWLIGAKKRRILAAAAAAGQGGAAA